MGSEVDCVALSNGLLRLLSEADRCGYEIVKLIAARSGGEYGLKEATMYSSVRRLEADGSMNEKLNQYLNSVFAPYDGVKSVAELKADLPSDLQERFRELNAAGKDDETAFAMTISSKRYRRLLTSSARWSGSC